MPKPRILLVTNLFPSSAEPTRGIFTQQQMKDLSQWYDITVIAPYPWLPGWARRLLKKGVDVPYHEQVAGFDVYHPRYLVTPKIGRALYGFFFFFGIYRTLARLKQQINPAFISAHWMYPDAYGAHLAAKRLGLPLVTHALGCDINEYTHYFWRRHWISKALKGSNEVVVVSSQIRDRCIDIGADPARVHVVLNGVDSKKFQPRDSRQARHQLQLPADKKILLFVGNYNIEKGLEYLVEAFKPIADGRDDVLLCVVGSGPLESHIKARIQALGLTEKVHLAGRVPHEQVPVYLNAADILCLPSLREGCPNIILEALASGTPIVSSRVGAVPDILAAIPTRAGILVEPQNAAALSTGLKEALDSNLTMSEPLHWMSWEESSHQVADIYAQLPQNQTAQ